MAKDPAFLFYSQDFYTGVSTMSFEDRGKYISILCLMHQQGRLSEESISFIVGLVSVNLKSKFCIDENGLWYNKRLEEETEKRNKFTESRRNNGLLGGRGNKKNKASAKASAKHMGNHMEAENENVNNINNGVPPLSEFLDFCKTIKEINYTAYEFSLKSKYESWVDNKWKDGNGNKIKNWKSKIKNTIPFLKPQEIKTSRNSNIPQI